MNTTKILSSALIAAAAFSAASAFAGDDNSYPVLPVQASTVTRAQVQAEVVQAQRAGTLRISDHDYPGNVATFASTKTRDQVKAELRAAQRAGYSERIDNSFPGNAV